LTALFAQRTDRQKATSTRPETLCISGAIGYSRNLFDSNIGDYLSFATFLQFPVSTEVQLRGGLRYFQSKNQFPFERLEYQGTERIGMFGQVWRFLSMDLIAKHAVSEISSLGLGLTFGVIDVKRVHPQAKAFRFDPYSDELLYFSQVTHERVFCAGGSGVADLNPITDWAVLPFFEIQFEVVYVGSKYGKTVLNVQTSFSAFIGLRYPMR
jgi:hypothetical protein